ARQRSPVAGAASRSVAKAALFARRAAPRALVVGLMISRSIARRLPRFGTALLAASLLACSDAPRESSSPAASGEWRQLGGSLARTYFNPDETAINRDTVGRLVPRWRFLTGAVVTSSPVVATVSLPDRGETKLVFASSWDGNLYALTARDGEL